MLISRRTLLLAAAAATVGGCSTKRELTGPAVNNPVGPVGAGLGGAGQGDAAQTDSGQLGASPIDARRALDKPNPDVDSVPSSVVMIGDSISARSEVALGVVLKAMGFDSVTINAESSRRIDVGNRRPTNGMDVVTFVAGSDPPEMWVIALGTNDAGLYTTDEEYQGLIDGLLDVIGDDAPLVWVNTYREDHIDGCIQFNNLLRATLDDRGNATVADWFQQCVSRDVLTDDGVHPNDDGILVFADMVRAAIATRLD